MGPLPEDGLTVIHESPLAVHAQVPVVRVRLNENDPPSPMVLWDVVLSV
jgi:hypothetical protein